MEPDRKIIIEECLRYLEKHKSLFGLSDYKLFIQNQETSGEDTCIAAADYDIYDKIITISLYEKFFERTDWKETMIHELIHAKIGIYREKTEKKCESVSYEEEEEAVNDITKGVMTLLETIKDLKTKSEEQKPDESTSPVY